MENMENKVGTETTEQNPETKATETQTQSITQADLDAKDKEISNLKKLLSNANSEASNYKKQLRERQTEEERRTAEIEEQRKAEQAELETLRKEKQLASYANEFISLGMDKDLAYSTAQAKADGDDTTVFANLRTLTENISKNAVVKAMDNQGGLSVGNAPQSQTAEDKIVAAAKKYAGL